MTDGYNDVDVGHCLHNIPGPQGRMEEKPSTE